MLKLSFSACQRYILSPASYFFHYYLRLRPIKTGSALIFGSALDSGFNSLLLDKKNSVEIDLQKAITKFNEVFDAPGLDKNNIQYSKADLDSSLLNDEELQRSIEEQSWLSLHKKGHILIDEYNKQVIPKIEKVLEVQYDFNCSNEIGDTFTGIVDLIVQIDGHSWLGDNKSTSITYKKDSADQSSQLATYYDVLKEQYNLVGVLYITIPKKLRKVKKPVIDIDFIYGKPSDSLIENTFKEYDEVLAGIKMGQFQCSRNCCKQPWPCPYRSYCDSNGQDLTGLEYQKESKKRT